MTTGIGGELLWLCPTLGGDAVDLTGLNTPTCDGGLASIAHTSHGGTRAYSFDGVNDCVTVPHDARFNFGTGDFCISLHCKPTTSGAADLVQKILGTGTFRGWSCQRVPAARLVNQSNHTSRNITVDVWSHCVFQRIATQSTVWVNGKCVADSTQSTTVDNTNDLKVGAFASGGWGGGWFTGLMDDIRVFGRELTALERGLLSTPAYQPAAAGGGARMVNVRGGADQ